MNVFAVKKKRCIFADESQKEHIMADLKEKWNEKLRHSLEVKRKAQEEARELLDKLQDELDTKGYYTLA